MVHAWYHYCIATFIFVFIRNPTRCNQEMFCWILLIFVSILSGNRSSDYGLFQVEIHVHFLFSRILWHVQPCTNLSHFLFKLLLKMYMYHPGFLLHVCTCNLTFYFYRNIAILGHFMSNQPRISLDISDFFQILGNDWDPWETARNGISRL